MATHTIKTATINNGNNEGQEIEIHELCLAVGDSSREFQDMYDGVTSYSVGSNNPKTRKGARILASKTVREFEFGGLPLRIVLIGRENMDDWSVCFQVPEGCGRNG